ncbi:hypothetical protein VPNG_10199 [Cytospora leucostoma]|uniref:RlpA-like protein double-psi beta-barrel domain-containing protein n=1 Tax=Cytospora leucostoma TaxID=1230097 RepID=A0A423VDA1_9PEZI|nr:hypothetical protein VPNG_10199 [Cytospora leucostoma]
MKSTTASLIFTALASMAIAQPHGRLHPARDAHQHGHQAQKRALVTEWEVEWVTETETVTEYVDYTTTQSFYQQTQTPSSPATTLATVTASAKNATSTFNSIPVVSEPVETPSLLSTYVAPPAPTTALSSSSTPEAYVAPEPTTSSSSSTSEVYVAPETTSSSSSEVYVAPQTTPSTTPVETPTTTPVVETPTTTPTTAAAVATTSTSAAAAAATTSASSGSTVSTNTNVVSALGSSSYYTGDITYYTLGLGACGTDNSGEDMTANIIAMSAETMGSQSNGNPMCGKKITIYNSANGKTATGTVQDKCPGCAAGSIDASQKLFEEVAELSQGRVEISWAWA